jgi:two-component system, cell cycle sensor histidine kinase and response regulator CckA
LSETAATTAVARSSHSNSAPLALAQPEFLGQLARAMANQLNNIMMALSTAAELELRKAQSSDKRSLQTILSHSARAAYLIQKLLVFSRQRTPSTQVVSLNALIEDIAGGIQQLAAEQVEVRTSLDPSVQRVRVDEVELEEILLGLALGPASRGTKAKLKISTELTTLGPEFLDAASDACPGTYAVLSIEEAEAGSGSPAPQLSQPQHDSVGQELKPIIPSAAIESIAQQAGGLFRIVRSPGELASFKIYFPAIGKEAPDEQASLSPKQVPSATILLVEDDEGVRLPAAEFLKMEGFKVLQAKTGAEALHIALRHRAVLDLLITDIVMPEMSGHEVAASLMEMYPGIKVLYMSGDPNQQLVGQVVEEAQNTALQKPFSLHTLHQRIKTLLGQKTVGA